jgi:Holliday junction DNA helicase RuvA
VLSALTVDELAEAVETGDLPLLQRSPGVGRKTAERILLELKDKMAATSTGRGDLRGDVVSALVNLGYSQRDAQRTVDAVWPEAGEGDLGNLLRMALQKLTR